MQPLYDKTRVQNKIRQIVEEATFNAILYSPGNDNSIVFSEEIRPSSVEVNQVSKEMEVDNRNGRSLVYRPSDWRFDLVLAFDKEASLAEIESAFRKVPRIQRNPENNQPLIFLRLRDADYEEPPRRGGPMRVIYTINADPERT